MCVPDETIVGATGTGGRGKLVPVPGKLSPTQSYTPPKQGSGLPFGFMPVQDFSLGIPSNTPGAPVVKRPQADSQVTVGADGIPRQKPQGYASLRIDRKGT